MSQHFVAECAITGPCGYCERQVTTPIPVHIDAGEDPLLKEEFLTNRTPELNCPACNGFKPLGEPILLYWGEHMCGIVPPGHLTAAGHLDFIEDHFANRRIQNNPVPSQALIFCRTEELAYFLKGDQCQMFAQNVFDLLAGHWSVEVDAMARFSNELLDAGNPAAAYLLWATVVRDLPSIYLHSDTRNALALCASAAADSSLERYGCPKSSAEDLDDIRAALDPQIPTWPGLDSVDVLSVAPLDATTGSPLEGSYNPIHVEHPPGE